MRRRMIAGVLLACAVAPAFGGYWTQYRPRPNAPWPEDQGWERITWYGGAERKIEDGALVLDSTGSGGIVDYYRVIAPGAVHAWPEHPFSAEFRLSVDYANAPEVGVTIFSDDRWGLAIRVSMDRVYSLYEYPYNVPITPGYHVYRITSPDMRTYVLSIDDVDAMTGSFYYSVNIDPSVVSWGDNGQGPVSLSRWSFVGFATLPKPNILPGFGIAPEPDTIVEISSVLVLVLRVLRRGRVGL